MTFKKGCTAWNKGKKFPEITAENNPNWKGDKVGYFAVHDWIEKKLGKPKYCVDCGTTDPNKKYHWCNISGKYKRDITDYKRLCVKCHRIFDWHLVNRGEKHGMSKLKNIEVIEIRKLYKTGKFCVNYISKKFNVTDENIHYIIKRKTWKHI